MDWTRWPDFPKHEMTCKCGECGLALMQPHVMDSLQVLRTRIGRPLGISSGYRCPKHNKAVRSTSTNHTGGWAVDIKCKAGGLRYDVLSEAPRLGFTRIGIHNDFIHLDMNPNMPQKIVWFY